MEIGNFGVKYRKIYYDIIKEGIGFIIINICSVLINFYNFFFSFYYFILLGVGFS